MGRDPHLGSRHPAKHRIESNCFSDVSADAQWFVLSVVALVFYFYRAWRRVGAIPNKAAYIAWMSIETVFALAALAGLVWFFVTPS